jgi:hypothetical protein
MCLRCNDALEMQRHCAVYLCCLWCLLHRVLQLVLSLHVGRFPIFWRSICCVQSLSELRMCALFQQWCYHTSLSRIFYNCILLSFIACILYLSLQYVWLCIPSNFLSPSHFATTTLYLHNIHRSSTLSRPSSWAPLQLVFKPRRAASWPSKSA